MKTTKMWLVALAIAGCTTTEPAATVDLGTGPPGGITVTPNGAQLAVGWTSSPTPVGYYIYQGAGNQAPSFIAALSAPNSAFIATGLTVGTSYCYQVAAAFADGSLSGPSNSVCATATTSTGGTRLISGLFARPEDDSTPTAKMSLAEWHFVGTGWLLYPLPVVAGETIAGFSISAEKSNAATDLHAELFAQDATTGAVSTLGNDQFSTHGVTGAVTLSTSALSIVAAAGTSYLLGIQEGFGTPDGTTTVADAEISIR